MEKLSFQIKAVREAGQVERIHTLPHHGSYTVGQHCYGALSLLLLLHPDPSLPLIQAVLWHDTIERWLGDTPSPAKWGFPKLAEAIRQAEKQINRELKLIPHLFRQDEEWLKAVDILDLWLRGREEILMGNTNAVQLVRRCVSYIEDLCDEEKFPIQAKRFFLAEKDKPNGRLFDLFSENLEP